MTDARQLNQPLGQRWADGIAAEIGLGPADSLTEQQFRDLTTGAGIGGNRDAAKVIDECAWILTNTTGRSIISNVNGKPTPSVLASYGLYVNTEGMLQSPANADAPTRQVNTLIAPAALWATGCETTARRDHWSPCTVRHILCRRSLALQRNRFRDRPN